MSGWWKQLLELMDIDAPHTVVECAVPGPKPAAPEPIAAEPVVPEPFVSFPCAKCQTQIDLQERLEPGQVAVIECENCGASWSVVLPSIQIFDTTKYEPVWKHTAQTIGVENNG